MNVSEYIDGKTNTRFILNFDRFNEQLRSLTRQSILSLPHPTQKEIQAFTPLSSNHIIHIANMLATHKHVHSIFSSFVPNELPENIFWCKYFKYLYIESGKEEKYKTRLKHRERKRNEHLTHVLTVWKGLAENRKDQINPSVNAKEGLLLLTGTKNYLHNHTKNVFNCLIKIILPFSSTTSNQSKQLFKVFTSLYDRNMIYNPTIENALQEMSTNTAMKEIKQTKQLSEKKVIKQQSKQLKQKELKEKKEKKQAKKSTVITVQSHPTIQSQSHPVIDMNITNNANPINQPIQSKQLSSTRMSLDLQSTDIYSRESSQLIGNGFLNKPRLSDSEMKRYSITTNESDIPTYKFVIMAFTYLFSKTKKFHFQFIGPLLHFLLKHYTPLESYCIGQAFIQNCFYNGIYPLTLTQMDYLFIALDKLIRERNPEYHESLKVSTTSIYEHLIVNMLLPLLHSIDKFNALLLLQHIYLEGIIISLFQLKKQFIQHIHQLI